MSDPLSISRTSYSRLTILVTLRLRLMATIVFVFRSLASNTYPNDPEPRTERNSKSGSGVRLDILISYDILIIIFPRQI